MFGLDEGERKENKMREGKTFFPCLVSMNERKYKGIGKNKFLPRSIKPCLPKLGKSGRKSKKTVFTNQLEH